jgi:type I restriction enzyme, S subunit
VTAFESQPLLRLLKRPATYGIVKAGAFQRAGVPMVRGGDVRPGRILSDLPRVSESKSAEYSRTILQAGDVVVALVGYPGNSAVVPPTLAGANISRAVGLLRSGPLVEPSFLAHYLNSPRGRREFLKPSAGSAQLVVNLADLNKLELPLLPIADQQSIAEALSSFDEIIDLFERQVTKKRAIKQGMMQQLLTGKTRLPGFTKPWSETALGSVATVSMGQSPVGSSYNSSGQGVPLVQGNADIKQRRTIDRLWTTQPTKRCREGDVVLTVRAPVGYTAVAGRDSCLGRGVCSVAGGADNRYLFHALVFAEPRWAVFEQGSTFTAVNSNEVRSFTIPWPADSNERGAIASVFDDADVEMRLLQKGITKALDVKQGVMQELLTGRTRLPVREAVS